MAIESFNEKCDRVLNYLLDKPSQYIEMLSWDKFTSETGITKGDPVIDFLYKDKRFIEITTSSINISPLGTAFISHDSFCKNQSALETKQSLEWYNREDAKQRFDDYPTIKRQRNTAYVLGILMFILAIITLIVHFNK
jgi:hypothetical protein